MLTYRVGDHSFGVEGCPESLLGSRYKLFRCEEPSKLLFTVSFSHGESSPVTDQQGLTLLGDLTDVDVRVISYSQGDSYQLHAYYFGSPTLSIIIKSNSDFSVNHCTIYNVEDAVTMVDNTLMMLYAFASSSHKTLLFHSSVVKFNSCGYMFLGRSGTGKSTHTQLWLNHIEGTSLLNDDNPVVRLTDQGAIVYGSPWSGKTPCYKNESYRIGAVVKLQQHPENIISQLGYAQSVAALLPAVSKLPTVKSVEQGVQRTVVQLVQKISTYRLCCLPDKAAAELSHNTIVRK